MVKLGDETHFIVRVAIGNWEGWKISSDYYQQSLRFCFGGAFSCLSGKARQVVLRG